jgi:hypothetical protein
MDLLSVCSVLPFRMLVFSWTLSATDLKSQSHLYINGNGLQKLVVMILPSLLYYLTFTSKMDTDLAVQLL